MSERNWSPFEIRMVIHHHCSPAPFVDALAPIYPECVAKLRVAGILEYDFDSILKTTPKGEALVKAWCETPMPIQKWVDPRFDAALQD